MLTSPKDTTVPRTTTPLPERVHNLAEARQRYGDRADRLVAWLTTCDPLADRLTEALMATPGGRGLFERALMNPTRPPGPDAPEPLRDFFAEVTRVPTWVDWGRVERGGRALHRAGFFGGITLGVKSLVYGYCAPAGNKPLVLSGQLARQTPRRLNETSRFVQAVTAPGGLRIGQDGFAIALRVRMIHARIRHLIRQSGRWRPERWGAPINQHDMLATNLLFSSVLLAGLRQLGFQLDRDEAEDYMHLWRVVGWLIGVHPELLPATEAEALDYEQLIFITQGLPDQDSRDLVDALLKAPLHNIPPDATSAERARIQGHVRFAQGLCRVMIGAELADALQIPSTPWEHAVVPVRAVVRGLEGLRRAVPGATEWAVEKGLAYWEHIIELGSEGRPALFEPPERLWGVTAQRTAP